MNRPGALYLIPVPISETDPLVVLSPATLEAIRGLRTFIVESERSAGRFLAKVLSKEALADTSFSVLDEHTRNEEIPRLLERVLEGTSAGLISEAGCPCVADPGSGLVAEAHRRGVRVVPLVGPSSILLALMASGFDAQRFLFLGYIPAESTARKETLRRIERECRLDGITRIFIETPYRNKTVLGDMLAVLSGDTRLCVAASLGGPAERVRSGTVTSWKETEFELGKEPAVFLIAPGFASNREKRNSGSRPAPGRLPANPRRSVRAQNIRGSRGRGA